MVSSEALQARFARLAQDLEADEIGALAGALERIEVAAGERLLVDGLPSDALFLVDEGRLSVFLEPGDVTLGVGEVGPGAWVGELTMLEPGPTSATVRVEQDATLFKLTHDAFEAFRAAHPRGASLVLRAICRDLAARVRSSSNGLFRTAGERAFWYERTEVERRGLLSNLLATLMGAKR